MKIDFELLEKLAQAGATATVIIEFLKAEDAKREPKRKADRERKNAKPSEAKRKRAESTRNEATIDDSPRARLFREGGDILASLGRADRGARALLAQWLKLTHEDHQLVLATLMRARDLGVSDVAGWMLSTLNGKVKGNGTGTRSMAAAADDLIARAEGGAESGRTSVRDIEH